MKTLSILVAMLLTASSSFANDAKFSDPKIVLLGYKMVAQNNLPVVPKKDCTVSMNAQVVVGSVQCNIQVTVTAPTCGEATASALNQLSDAKNAIQTALQ